MALALCVFVAVPVFGIEEQGLGGYLKSYVEPTFIMLPFNIISEISRTLALAVRAVRQHDERSDDHRYSAGHCALRLSSVMMALGLLTGMVQAYIFFILATVYIAAATRTGKPKREPAPTP